MLNLIIHRAHFSDLNDTELYWLIGLIKHLSTDTCMYALKANFGTLASFTKHLEVIHLLTISIIKYK